jgi:FAD/FMN-containing dehydrogenase
MPYPAIFAFAEEATIRSGYAIRSLYLDSLPDALIDAIIDHGMRATSPASLTELRVLGGAMARVDPGATAFAHRDKPMMVTVVNSWREGDPAEHEAWTLNLWREIEAYGSGVYANFLQDEGEERVREAYSVRAYARLQDIKRRYDPTNVFHRNQNIQP